MEIRVLASCSDHRFENEMSHPFLTDPGYRTDRGSFGRGCLADRFVPSSLSSIIIKVWR